MTLKKTIKTILLFFVSVVGLFIVYSLIPRVINYKSDFGKALPKSDNLSKETKKEIRAFIKDTASRMQIVMAVHNGTIIFEEGDTKELINCHSARKSVMSLLIGIAIEKGYINLNETLEDINIDESKNPLTPQERSATVRNLLMACSGVYLPAEAEVSYATNHRPKREQYKPGEFFFYNNFDFNTLGTILEKNTGMSIGEFMEQYLAKPLGMEDFSSSNVVYGSPWPVPNKTNSDYPVFWIYLSARDFARIGMLVIQNGTWEDKQIVSSEWISRSLNDITLFSGQNAKMEAPYDAFGYSWWIENDTGTIWADGYGGQFLCIDKTNNLVVLQRNFTGNSLLTSGLFLMDKNRDNNPKSDLMHVYGQIKNELNKN